MAHVQFGRSVLQKIISRTQLRASDCIINQLQYRCHSVRHKKIEIILTTGVDKLGKAGDTVKVKPGYFRNFLMPRLLAVPNIPKFAHLIDEQRKVYQRDDTVEVIEEKKEDVMEECEKAAKRLVKSKLVIRTCVNAEKFRARSSKSDPIYVHTPLTKTNIVKEVGRQFGVQIEPENLHLPSPLTMFGEYEVPLILPPSIPVPDGMLRWALKVRIRGK